MLKNFRLIHRYLGLFIAPALLFFALTGALQTFSLHEPGKGTLGKPALSYKPSHWIVVLGQLHKNQTPVLPPTKNRLADAPKPKPDDFSAAAPKPAAPAAPSHSPVPLKYFFLLVAIGLFISTLTGIYMAYKFERSKVRVTILLILGAVVPLLLVLV